MRKRNLAGIVAGASVLLGGALYSESRGADVGVGVGLTPYFETSAEDFEPLVFEGVADFSFDALVLDVADLAINFSRKDVKALRNSLESIGRELENGYYEFLRAKSNYFPRAKAEIDTFVIDKNGCKPYMRVIGAP
ncbi:MAG: hypothetical protein AABY05_01940 [Nanoarchaeota archaeon]